MAEIEVVLPEVVVDGKEEDEKEREAVNQEDEYKITDSLLFEYNKEEKSVPNLPEAVEEYEAAGKDGQGVGLTCCFSLFLLTGVILLLSEDFQDRSAVYIAGVVIISFASICIFPLCMVQCCCGAGPNRISDAHKVDKASVDEKFELRRLNNLWQTKQKQKLLNKERPKLSNYAHKTLKALSEREKAAEGRKKKQKLKEIDYAIQEALKRNPMATEAEIRNLLQPSIYVIRFKGDIMVSKMDIFRDQISMVIQLASKLDEVVVLIESPGGAVQPYGLAASQLMRIKEHGIKLTVCVDVIAASGGYMMAVCADHLVAAPFALIGSIGVVTYMANVQRFLDEKKVDAYLFTAGEYKRTVDFVGEVTPAGIEKQQEELDLVHDAFKNHVQANRQDINVDDIATGEAWLATDALARGLIDEIKTSDEYLSEKCSRFDVYEIIEKEDKSSWYLKLFEDQLSVGIKKFGESVYKRIVEQVKGKKHQYRATLV